MVRRRCTLVTRRREQDEYVKVGQFNVWKGWYAEMPEALWQRVGMQSDKLAGNSQELRALEARAAA